MEPVPGFVDEVEVSHDECVRVRTLGRGQLAYLFLPQGGLRAWIQIDVGYLEESLLGEEVEHLQTLVGQGEGVHLVAFG